MPSTSAPRHILKHTPSRARVRYARRRSRLFMLLCALVIPALLASPGLPSPSAAGAPLDAPAAAVAVRPFVYAMTSSVTTYDIMFSDGVNKDRRIARIKVDSVYFGDVSASLSTDGSYAVFRVTGDRLGGSSLYQINVTTGKYAAIAASKTGSEGIGAYAWSPVGNTMAYVRSAPALDPAQVDDAYGSIYLFSVGFQALELKTSAGNDRLLGFSSDGLGVYVARRETANNVTLEHLVYLPISGEPGAVMLRSRPGLQYTGYSLWAPLGSVPRVAYLAEGDFSLAAGNSNVQEVIPALAGSVRVDAKVPVAGKLTRPSGRGLVVSDPLGLTPVLLRRDAENYTHISWTPDGSGLLVGGSRSGAAWRVAASDGSRVALGASVLGLRPASQGTAGSLVVLADNPTTRLVSIDYSSGKVAATRYVGVAVKPGAAVKSLSVPYIHQVNDTAATADGNWACGPTSIAMALAYYGKLEPWSTMQAANKVSIDAVPAAPAAPAAPPKAPTGADFAPYVTNSYTINGHSYSSKARDPRGNMIAGLYGTICPTGLADWKTMIQVLQWHGLNSDYVAATWDGIVGALKRGHPVLLGNMLTSEGHIVLVVGYTADGNLIVNDPYGNKFAPGYGSNDGQGVVYPWKRLTARRAVEVIGIWPPPTATPTITPTATATSTPTSTPSPTNTPVPFIGPQAPSPSPSAATAP